MEQLVRIPCSSSLNSVTPFSIADILMTRGQEVLQRAQAQDQALDMTHKPAGKLHGEYLYVISFLVTKRNSTTLSLKI
jgi:hypothetical protein